MSNRNTFRTEVGYYCEQVNKTQAALARAINRDSSELNKRLHGKGAVLTTTDIRNIVKTLAGWEAITHVDQAIYLLSLMNCNFNAADWNIPPLSKLRSETRSFKGQIEQKQTPSTVAQYASPPFDEALLIPPEHFIGRREDLRWLRNRLLAGGTTSISALGGMGGIGKTALATVAIRQLRQEGYFRDGIAVEICLGKTNGNEVVRQILARFDPNRRRPETDEPSELIDIAHGLLDGKDALIVLDNVEPELDIAQVVTTLRAAATTLLITARHTLPGTVVSSEESRSLDLLSLEEAIDLFAQSFGKRTGSNLSTTEYISAEDIVRALELHTLAVKLAGAYAFDCKRSLRELAKELSDPQQGLELPDGEIPRAVILSFARSIDGLADDAQQLFAALSTFATAGFGRRAALALGVSLHLAAPNKVLELLIRRALVEASANEALPEESDYERLRFHPLIRAFSVRMRSLWSQDENRTSQHAVALYYSQYVNKVPHKGLGIDDANIAGALEWAHGHGEDGLVAILCLGMHTFWRDRARTLEAFHYLPWGITALETPSSLTVSRENRLQAARLVLTYGQMLREIGELAEAEHRLLRLLEIYHKEQHPQGEGEVFTFLGQIAKDRGQLDKAHHYFEQSLAIHRETQDLRGQGWSLSYLGRIAQYREQMSEAERYYQESLTIHRKLQDQRSEAWILGWLGQISVIRGGLGEAERLYLNALDIHRQNEDRRGEASILLLLGRIAEIRGQLLEARSRYQECLAIFREIRDSRSVGWRLCDVGRVVQAGGQLDEAKSCYEESLTLFSRVHDRQGTGEALICLGRLAMARGERDEGSSLLQQALTINREVEYRSGECLALSLLGEIAMMQSDYERADDLFQQAFDVVRKGENRLLQGRILFLTKNCAEARGDVDRAKFLSHEILAILTEVGVYVTNSLLSYSYC